MDEDDVQWAMRQIRAYLREFPRAADTVAGVHAVWVGWPQPAPTEEVTERALVELERLGEVRRVAVGGRDEVWRKGARG